MARKLPLYEDITVEQALGMAFDHVILGSFAPRVHLSSNQGYLLWLDYDRMDTKSGAIWGQCRDGTADIAYRQTDIETVSQMLKSSYDLKRYKLDVR